MPQSNEYKMSGLKLNNKVGIGLLVLFFFSRLIFINSKEVFFDSKEYLTLFANASFYNAVTLGHTPIHEGYILLFWPVYQFAQLLHFDPGYCVVIGQIVLAVITIFCYYKTITFLFDKKLGLLSAIIISLTPLFWITNVTITLEVSYLSFYFLSSYLLTLYLSKNKLYYLLLSFFCLGFSFITYSAVLLWLPVYLAIVFIKKRQVFIKVFFCLGIFLFFTLIARLLILSAIFNGTIFTMLHDFYLANASDAGYIPNNFWGLLIRIRNFIPLLRDYTSLVFILSMLSLFVSFFKNKKIFFLGLLWIIPILYTNQWWDTLFMGRYSILAGFGIALLTGYLIGRYRALVPVGILYLLIVSLPALSLLRAETPYMQEEQFAQTLPNNGLLIESHFALPVLEKCCGIRIIGANRPDMLNAKLQKVINLYLKNKKPVFISSAALSEPYGLYTGPYLHPLSLSYDHGYALSPLLIQYRWKMYKVINTKDNLIVYQILEPGKSTYPKVLNLKRHYRRLDYYDPITRIWWFGEDLFSSRK